MSDDISFKIQLGLVLPQMEKELGDKIYEISKNISETIKAGSVEDAQDFPIDEVKNIFMQDIEIFFDKNILPKIKEEFVPAAAEEPENEETEAVEEGDEE